MGFGESCYRWRISGGEDTACCTSLVDEGAEISPLPLRHHKSARPNQLRFAPLRIRGDEVCTRGDRPLGGVPGVSGPHHLPLCKLRGSRSPRALLWTISDSEHRVLILATPPAFEVYDVKLKFYCRVHLVAEYCERRDELLTSSRKVLSANAFCLPVNACLEGDNLAANSERDFDYLVLDAGLLVFVC